MALCVDSYMATSGADRKLKLWDLRTLKELSSCSLRAGAGHLAFSQRTLLACAVDRQVQVSFSLVFKPPLTLVLDVENSRNIAYRIFSLFTAMSTDHNIVMTGEEIYMRKYDTLFYAVFSV